MRNPHDRSEMGQTTEARIPSRKARLRQRLAFGVLAALVSISALVRAGQAEEALEKGLPGTLRFEDPIPEPGAPKNNADKRDAPKPNPSPDSQPWGSFVRVTAERDKNLITLEVAIQEYKKPDASGPTVALVGVTHIGDASYYDALQKYLDAQDLVLFEGVKPSSGADELPADDASRVKITTQRIRLLGVLVERHRSKNKELPASLDAMIGALSGQAKRVAEAATKDAWGNSLTYTRAKELRGGFDIASLGSDAKEGGEGVAADLKLSQDKPISKKEKEGGDGIQVKLARALGLQFQLAALDYDRPHWRNSDITVERLEERFEEAGVDGSMLLGMLDGSSFGSKLMGLLLGFIEGSPQLSTQVKIMVAEMLSHGDALGAGQLGALMDVLIKDRNKIVMADLARELEAKPARTSIAVFYGAGHLPDMDERLRAMGFAPADTRWLKAIAIDVSNFEGGFDQAESVRGMVRKMVEVQAGKK